MTILNVALMSTFYSICVLVIAGLQNKVVVNRLDILRLWDLMMAGALNRQ